MLELAKNNAKESGVSNATFLKGTIRKRPASRCVGVRGDLKLHHHNLAEDKGAVIKEAFRLLRPGGLFAVGDMVGLEPLDPTTKEDLDSWAGCLSGTIPIDEYRSALSSAGFQNPDFQVHATECMPGVAGKIGSA